MKTEGNLVNPKVLAVFDPPSRQVWDRGGILSPPCWRVFRQAATDCGFERGEFAYLAAATPLPEDATTEKRIGNHLATCREEFLREYEALASKVKLVMFFGNQAGKQVMGHAVKITQARGKIIEDGPVPILPMLSLGNVLRRPEVADVFTSDFRMAGAMRAAGWSMARTGGAGSNYRWCMDLSEEFDLDKPPAVMGFDTETAGGDWYRGGRILTVQLSWRDNDAVAIPLDIDYWNDPMMRGKTSDGFPELTIRGRMKLIHQLRRVLGNPKVAVCCSNPKYDMHMALNYNIHVANMLHDTVQLAFVVDDNMQNKGLDECVRRWLPTHAGYADCVVPETEILSYDMRKVKAGDLSVGDELCAFSAETDGRKAARRRMCKSTVTGVQRLVKRCIRITTESGRQTTVSHGHLMLSKTGMSDRGGGWRWRRAADLTMGAVLKPFAWYDPATDFDAGYVSGLIDGEGWFCKGSNRLGVAQQPGQVLEKFKSIVCRHGIEWGHSTDIRKKVGVVNVTFNGDSCFRVLQVFRPLRLLEAGKWQGHGLPTDGKCYDRIVRMEHVGEREVIGLRTTSQTIIADGLLSHNSFNAKVDKGHMERVPHDELLPYAAGDADVVRQLTKVMVPLAKQDERNYACYTKVQMPAMRMFLRMEREGIRMDTEALQRLVEEAARQEDELRRGLVGRIDARLRRALLEEAGETERVEDVLSPARDEVIRRVLFSPKSQGGFGYKPVRFTKGTAKLTPEERVPSTSAKDHLVYFESNDWVLDLMDYKRLQKMRSTYIGGPAQTTFERPAMLKSGNKYTKRVQDALEASGEAFVYGEGQGHPTGSTRVIGALAGGKQLCLDAAGEPWIREDCPASGFWSYLSDTDDIHPSFLLHATVTGRTASRGPNAQNIPKRGRSKRANDLVKAYRRCFVARQGHTLLEPDLSQAELRVAAWMAQDRTMLELYRHGGDVHAMTAARVMGITLEEFMALPSDVRKMKRFLAKAVNFGYIYGMGWPGFKIYAKTEYGLELTDREAEANRQLFFGLYDGLEPWHKGTEQFVKTQGYVRALHGALRRLPSVYSDDDGVVSGAVRAAINSPVQRFASDLALMGMTRYGMQCPWEEQHPILFIHDACIVEAREEVAEEAASAVLYFMENVPLLEMFGLTPPLPLTAEVAIGPNLADMEERLDIKAVRPMWAV